ncbi:hypothetical protein TVAG_486670 [Trichomonas vaginalis G3]|uniref:Uncharacterized protein n=1 Tax=Trichomonas vaginalis (strain ATCC PRA-98 / G3) TaxID=412133 RepID=A2DZ95_TRIV3|nr:hypothetical protein TVAGG3_1016220 [Trichomonas vaginalis G3]EAY14224.1 hypothetical protein TVAG_486670 [Trichomonas vaginalis G3]KAI5491832.1 hypothetical protein TVAGG3_1016220 [Trichomonas vaginalis G3]|eukprot:XP_001326447.1 hypothetical protein [Trichomonas vaginalis G3]
MSENQNEPKEKKIQYTPEIKFRIYETDNESLKRFEDLIDVEPVDTIEKVNKIISDSEQSSPDKPGTPIQLAQRKKDIDLKRMMEPQIQDLLSETLGVLRKYGASAQH